MTERSAPAALLDILTSGLVPLSSDSVGSKGGGNEAGTRGLSKRSNSKICLGCLCFFGMGHFCG